MEKSDHTTTEAQRAARSANAAKATEGRKAAVAARRTEAAAKVAADLKAAGVPALEVSEARLMAAKAEIAELDAGERRGELISVEQARADVIDKFTTVRTKILGVPSRVAQRFPKLAPEIVPVLEDLLREALTELADEVE